MAQAESIPSTSTTRRKALAAIASVTGAAAMVTPAIALADGSRDAELLELGRQLTELIPIERAATEKMQRLHAQCEQFASEKVGFTLEEANRDSDRMRHAEWIAEFERIGSLTGYNSLFDESSSLPVYPLLDAIRAAKATTIQGVAVKAQAVAWAFVYHDGSIEDYEIDDLVNSACAVAGVQRIAT